MGRHVNPFERWEEIRRKEPIFQPCLGNKKMREHQGVGKRNLKFEFSDIWTQEGKSNIFAEKKGLYFIANFYYNKK